MNQLKLKQLRKLLAKLNKPYWILEGGALLYLKSISTHRKSGSIINWTSSKVLDYSLPDERIIPNDEVYISVLELKLTSKELYDLWTSCSDYRWSKRSQNSIAGSINYNHMPNPTKRDNKSTYVGSGGSSSNRVRFPSKKRSRSTWKKFYNLFPEIGRLDNWDGKTSKRI